MTGSTPPPDAKDWILTLNAGSSSLKLAAFDPQGAPRAARTLAGIDVNRLDPAALDAPLADIRARERLAPAPLAVGHRVVHGLDMRAPRVIDAATRAVIERAAEFAPLHNPPALRVIDMAARLWPGAPQIACFDTAFHADNPPVATTFPIPADLRAAGLRRYGFHGLSYASTVRRFAALVGRPLPRRLLICHLGAGASMAAVRDGRGVATTMGFSPMDGLVMATRAGAMDPGLILHLLHEGMTPAALDALLNRQSGLLALGGSGDMKTLLESPSPEAAFAVSHYCHWASRHAGSMIAAMRGVDGLVFTGGVGENAAPVRARILENLRWSGIGRDNHWVIPADEEGEIAHAVLATRPENPGAGHRS